MAKRHAGKSKVVAEVRHWQTRAPTRIKKHITSLYDIGFPSSNIWIEANEVGYDMTYCELPTI